MIIQFKITTWEKIETFNKNIDNDVIEKIKSGVIKCSDDMYTYYNYKYGDFSHQLFTDAGTQVTPSNNNGEPTIEMYDDNMNLIWDNGRNK